MGTLLSRWQEYTLRQHTKQFSSMFKRFYLNMLSLTLALYFYKFICMKTTNVKSHRFKMTYVYKVGHSSYYLVVNFEITRMYGGCKSTQM